MNLIHHDQQWLTLLQQGGETRQAPVIDLILVDYKDIVSPRPDFRGALYQFLIGLLQTAYAPADLDEWLERWHTPPTAEALAATFAPFLAAFEFDGDGPAFMQDYALPDGETKPIAGLLIDAPGEKTQKDNLDHFVKGGRIEAMCTACAATALFTLQINAPSGGVGHRVSLRGGGPLTTLLVPRDSDATLWQKLWLNVLPLDTFASDTVPNPAQPLVLPWLAPTRISDAKGVETTPESVHVLQAYWSMPRRIRLDFAHTKAGVCDVCGAEHPALISQYRTKNYGVNYTGAWRHPLTPYSLDPKQDNLPLSIKGQKGGIAYRQWASLALEADEDELLKPAAVVQGCNAKLARLYPDYRQQAQHAPRLWCFGFDMDNMKARCWYDTTLPLYGVADEANLARFRTDVQQLIDTANEAQSLLGKYVKAARFSRPGDVGADPAVPQSFWQGTEILFYRSLQALATAEVLDDTSSAAIKRHWLVRLRKTTLALFDDWVLSAPIEQMDMARVIKARLDLEKWLNAAKPLKALWSMINNVAKENA